MKNRIKDFGIKKIFIIIVSMILLTGVAYAATTAALTKSSYLPWQGTTNGYYDSAHNVGTSYVPESRFSFTSGSSVGGTSVVLDSITGLSWQSNGTATGTLTWTGAKTYCANLTLGGKSDWRLPNYKELTSIIDLSRYNPSIDTNYFTATNDFYWSSTVGTTNTSNAWLVSFFNGYTNSNNKTYTRYVRCVR